MSCYDQCLPCLPCWPCSQTPLANSCTEPCVRQCQDSTIGIEPSPTSGCPPPPMVVPLPSPILSFFPQTTTVGPSTSAAVSSILR
ncbi:Feather keratin Cos1-1/Cos1-3/Cos2-1, partial [Phoenicopterus ruber ruber]